MRLLWLPEQETTKLGLKTIELYSLEAGNGSQGVGRAGSLWRLSQASLQPLMSPEVLGLKTHHFNFCVCLCVAFPFGCLCLKYPSPF